MAPLPLCCAGADLYALCADAWMGALKRRIAELGSSPVGAGQGSAAKPQGVQGPGVKKEETEQGSEEEEEEEKVLVSMADFDASLAALVPSLSLEEVAKYERLRDHYESKGQKPK